MRYEKTACFILGLIWAIIFIAMLKANAERDAKMDQWIKAGDREAIHAYIESRSHRPLNIKIVIVWLALVIPTGFVLYKSTYRPWWLYLLIALVGSWKPLMDVLYP